MELIVTFSILTAVTVTSAQQTSEPATKNRCTCGTGDVIGAIFGTAIGLLLIEVIIFIIYKRCRGNSIEKEDKQESISKPKSPPPPPPSQASQRFDQDLDPVPEDNNPKYMTMKDRANNSEYAEMIDSVYVQKDTGKENLHYVDMKDNMYVQKDTGKENLDYVDMKDKMYVQKDTPEGAQNSEYAEIINT
ncbi:uncharacterized protein [Amphiura filiformis]|uniref:uncharacterized protein isoform X3 n=1 Tax=Amphiura filiformis TaxID=82378 RepID=UPI003B21296A